MRVIALDQATHKTGYAIYEGTQLIQSGVFEAKGKEETARIHQVKEWFNNIIEEYKPDYVGFEELVVGNSFTTQRTLARLQGVLMEEAYVHSVKTILCNPQSWRSTCGCKGANREAQKTNMIALVKKWYDKIVTDDEADAIGIGKHIVTKCVAQQFKNWE